MGSFSLSRAISQNLRDIFLGRNEQAVFASMPDLPREAFGAQNSALLVPIAERAGLLPHGDILVPDDATTIRFGLGHGSKPYEGEWTEIRQPIPRGADLRRWRLKEQLIEMMLVKSSGYSCCWFIGVN